MHYEGGDRPISGVLTVPEELFTALIDQVKRNGQECAALIEAVGSLIECMQEILLEADSPDL